MSKVSVVAVGGELAPQVVDLLADWEALGMLDEVFVLDLADAADPQLPAMRINGSRTGRISLSDELAARHDLELLRLSVLSVPGIGMVQRETADDLRRSVMRAMAGREPTAVNVVAARPGQEFDVPSAIWLGWHNVVVAPENSASPAAGTSLLPPDGPLPMNHTVASLCGMLGLFAGHEDGLFDQRQLLPGQQLYVARTFTRFLSADALEDEVLTKVADVRDRYPVPRYDGASVLVVDDEQADAVHMAELLWQKHPELHARPRQPAAAPPPMKIGAMEALRRFFAFLWAALRNAPGDFASRLVHGVRQRTANAVQSVVFGGSDSNYAVVVSGVTAEGRPADAQTVDAALDALADRTAGGYPVQHDQRSLAPFWRDYVNGGLTLLDAGQRSTDLPPRTVGASRAVVTSTNRVVPNKDFEVGHDVAGYLPGWRLQAGDMLHALLLQNQLETVGREHSHLTDAVARERRAVQEYGADADGSYSGRIGYRIASDLVRSITDIRTMNQLLAELQNAPDPSAELEAKQRKLGRIMMGIAIGSLLLTVVFILLIVFGAFAWWVGLLLILATLLGWFFGSLMVFMRQQRTFFEMLHRREAGALAAQIYKKNLAEAIEDARRLNRAYRQYQDWSKAFGAFVHAPLGAPKDRDRAQILIGPGLPRNLQLGVNHVPSQVVTEQTSVLRRNLFEAGWLKDAWEAFERDLPPGLGEWQYNLREQPEMLWSDPRVAADTSILSVWSQAVALHAPNRDIPQSFARKLKGLIDSDREQVATQLRQQVRFRRNDNGAIENTTYDSFVSGLDNLSGGQYVFDTGLFAQNTPTVAPWQVAETERQEARSSLKFSVVVTQLSAGLNPQDLVTSARTTPQPDPGWQAPPTAPPMEGWSDI